VTRSPGHLLGFRHFFRHADAVSLDPVRLARLRDDAKHARSLLGPELDALDAFLEELARAAT
jgi:hypothetical protein